MSFDARGQSGELRNGYQVAARLGPWSLDDGGRVEAAVRETNAFWLDEPGPLALWLVVGRRAWVWRAADVVDRGTPMVIRVSGSPDVRDAPRTS